MTIAQQLHDAFKGREHFTMDDIIAELPTIRALSAYSVISRHNNVYFEYVSVGMYRIIGERPPDKRPGRNKGSPKYKNPPARQSVAGIVLDWIKKPVRIPVILEGWRK